MSAKKKYFNPFVRTIMKATLVLLVGFMIINSNTISHVELALLTALSAIDLFLIFYTKPQEKGNSFKNLVSPKIQKEQKMMFLVNQTLSFVAALVCMLILLKAANTQSTFSCVVLATALTCSLVKLVRSHPSVYNQVSYRNKILPVPEYLNTEKLIYLLRGIITPYGTVKVGQYMTSPMGYYKISGTKCVVYFFVKNEHLYIRTAQFGKRTITESAAREAVSNFTRQLSDICCYTLNTGYTPNQVALNQIFGVN